MSSVHRCPSPVYTTGWPSMAMWNALLCRFHRSLSWPERLLASHGAQLAANRPRLTLSWESCPQTCKLSNAAEWIEWDRGPKASRARLLILLIPRHKHDLQHDSLPEVISAATPLVTSEALDGTGGMHVVKPPRWLNSYSWTDAAVYPVYIFWAILAVWTPLVLGWAGISSLLYTGIHLIE
jgi:hypothetical protein